MKPWTFAGCFVLEVCLWVFIFIAGFCLGLDHRRDVFWMQAIERGFAEPIYDENRIVGFRWKKD